MLHDDCCSCSMLTLGQPMWLMASSLTLLMHNSSALSMEGEKDIGSKVIN